MLFDGRIIAGITVFVAVANTGTYARAADHVGLSRSGVSKAISRLEERTGMRLFDRNSRALKLTDEGRAFLAEVSPLLDRLGRVAKPSRPGDVRGRLRISTDGAFGPHILVPALPRLLSVHPRLRIELIVRDRVENLLMEGVDVAIRFGEPDARNVDKQLIMTSRVLTCASPAYLSRHPSLQTPDDIRTDHTCVRMLDDVTGRPHPWDFERTNGERRTLTSDCGLTVNDAASLVAAALNDYGLVRLLDIVAAEHLESGRLVEVLPEWNFRPWPAYLYTSPYAQGSHAIEVFTAFATSGALGGRLARTAD